MYIENQSLHSQFYRNMRRPLLPMRPFSQPILSIFSPGGFLDKKLSTLKRWHQQNHSLIACFCVGSFLWRNQRHAGAHQLLSKVEFADHDGGCTYRRKQCHEISIFKLPQFLKFDHFSVDSVDLFFIFSEVSFLETPLLFLLLFFLVVALIGVQAETHIFCNPQIEFIYKVCALFLMCDCLKLSYRFIISRQTLHDISLKVFEGRNYILSILKFVFELYDLTLQFLEEDIYLSSFHDDACAVILFLYDPEEFVEMHDFMIRVRLQLTEVANQAWSWTIQRETDFVEWFFPMTWIFANQSLFQLAKIHQFDVIIK